MGRKLINLTGKKFNMLTVIERDTNNASREAKWICQCDCGNIISVTSGALKSGHTKSCGCLRNKKEILDGQKFGRLVVLKEDDNNNKKCICLCDCGNIISVYKGNLKRGLTTSCGCYQKEAASKSNIKDLTGQRFGRLTVIQRIENKGNNVQYLCKCDCGNMVNVISMSLLNGGTRSCGCLKSELSSERFSLKLEGKKFGKLTVVKRAGTCVGADGTKYSQWECNCECGTTVIVKGHDLVCGRVTSCGCTASRGEEEIRKILNQMNIKFIPQYSFDDLKSDKGWKLRFDFGIVDNDNNLIALIEYQGVQHFVEQPMGFGKYEREISDKLKQEYCDVNNIPLFEIVYDDDIELAIEDIIDALGL